MRFKVPLLASDEEFERVAAVVAVVVFLASAALLGAAPVAAFSAPLELAAVAAVLDSLAALLVVFILGMAPVGRIAVVELHTLSPPPLSCCSSAAAAAAAAAITAVAGPADAERAARSMETLGVSGEQWCAAATAAAVVLYMFVMLCEFSPCRQLKKEEALFLTGTLTWP